MSKDVQGAVLELLQKLKGVDPLKRLFWSELNYDRLNQACSTTGWPAHISAFLSENPVLLASHHDFYVIYSRLKSDLRTGQERQIINQLIKNYPYALFVFSDDHQESWHFINVKNHPEVQKRKVFRRITIHPNDHYRTASERLALIDIESISNTLPSEISPLAIQERHDEAFNVEKIGKEFFLGYRDHFWMFVDSIRSFNKGKSHFIGEKGDENLHRFTQLLLGRILFLYFIQKKGWLNNDKAFLQGLFTPYQEGGGSGFYWDCLEPLFFNGLNSPGKQKIIGEKRYEIPYLNGGLFEPRDTFFEGDILKRAVIPDQNFDSFFNFLGAYNFTIAESTPLDQDVDIDPEMLGKVFENLLASEDRHSSGTYYTPRNIVEFMCRESLFYHLESQTRTERSNFNQLFESLLEGKHPDIGKDSARKLQSCLREIKVLDPAVGSGAFLLGMLHELIQLRSVCGRILGESEAVQTGKLGDWKREIIGNNLFGVDNNPEACEIARLRLWLSMVVDETEASPLPNLDYRIVEGNTLREKLDGELILPPGGGPGFEKEDDLFQTEKPQGSLYATERSARTASIVQHLSSYYRTNADQEKRHLRKSIEEDLSVILEEHWRSHEEKWDRQQRQILDKALQLHKKPDDLPRDWAGKLEEAKSHLERIEKEREALRRTGTWPVTPLRLFFAEAFAGNPGGFDIVIANPPYVRQELIRPLKPYLQEEFGDFFSSTADLYTYFYARGLELLRPGGFLCFIAPNKFMRAGYGKNTRQLLTAQAKPRMILDFGDLPIFEATTYPSILLIEKTKTEENDYAVTMVMENPQQIEEISQTVAEKGFPMPVKSLSDDGWALEQPEVLRLMVKIREKGIPLGEYVNGRFYRGILTGFNKAFVIDENIRKKLIKEDPKSKEIIKPWLRGRDIKKWRDEWAALYVIFTRRGVDINRYPAIKKYLQQFKDDLMPKTSENQKRGRKPGPYAWYEIQDNIAYYLEFENPKIVYPDLATEPRFSFDKAGLYADCTAFVIPSGDSYLLALLNSILMRFFFSCLSASVRGGFLRFKTLYMEKLPLFPASEKQKIPIASRVDAILKDPTGPEASRLESEIDELIFELYGLTSDEIKVLKRVIDA